MSAGEFSSVEELSLSETDESLMRQTLLQCYSAGNGFHVSREHYRYLAEQVVALRQHSKREHDRLRAQNAKLVDALRMIVAGGYDEASRVFAGEIAASAIKDTRLPR